jgi:hypothetical protein
MRAVLHRKNSLFYCTLNGAQVGDLFMSRIHTCQLCGVNSFDYLIELQRHAQELAAWSWLRYSSAFAARFAAAPGPSIGSTWTGSPSRSITTSSGRLLSKSCVAKECIIEIKRRRGAFAPLRLK